MTAARVSGVMLMVTVLCSACASAGHPLSTPMTRAPRAAANAAERLETRDPALRLALARVNRAPTAANFREAAHRYAHHRIFDRSVDLLTRSLEINGPDAATHDALARVWRDWGVPREALVHAHRAIFLAPRWAAAHNTLGTILFRLGLGADAKASFARAVTLDGRASYARSNLCHATHPGDASCSQPRQ